MNVPTELIEEATRRGIVEGATCHCSCASTDVRLIPSTNKWTLDPDGISVSFFGGGKDYHNEFWIRSQKREWATVITPAPSVGLQEGDACEAGPAMRAAIIELAKELGLPSYQGSHEWGRCLGWTDNAIGVGSEPFSTSNCFKSNHTPEAFIAKMRATAKQPKPIKIGEWTVKFNKGGIEVGYTSIDNATVRAIAEKLQD